MGAREKKRFCHVVHVVVYHRHPIKLNEAVMRAPRSGKELTPECCGIMTLWGTTSLANKQRVNHGPWGKPWRPDEPPFMHGKARQRAVLVYGPYRPSPHEADRRQFVMV